MMVFYYIYFITKFKKVLTNFKKSRIIKSDIIKKLIRSLKCQNTWKKKQN